MKKKLLALLILALLLFVPFMAHAATAGKFTSVEGSVDVTSPGKEARPANLGDLLNVGDIIRTKSKSKCEVAFQDGSILRLGENSRLRVNEFAQEKGERNATLELFRGKIQNVVTAVKGSAGQSKYEIQTSTAVCGVRGTDFFVYHQAGVTGAAFREGTGYGYSRNRPQDVRTIDAGQAMTVSGPNVPPVIRPASASEINQHRKDTAPSEKPKSEVKKEEEKRAESLAPMAGEGRKEEQRSEESRPVDIVAQTIETPTSAELSILPDTTAPSQAGLSSPAATPATTLTAGSSGTDAVIVVPISDMPPPKITRLIPENFSDYTKITNQSSAAFTVAFDKPATISYSLDGNNYVTAAGDKLILTGLPEGSNTVSVKGIDSAGKASPAVSYSWTTDYNAPTITLSGTPAAVTNAATANFAVTASEQATYAYTLNGATVASPSLTNLPAGSNTFTVTATDPVGNTAVKTYSWTTDYTAPTITLSGTPAAITNAATANFVVTANEQVTYAYTLNGATVTSPNLTNLPAGSNTFIVTATDPAGNTSTKTYAWTTDYTVPTITILAPPAANTNTATVIVSTNESTNQQTTYTVNINDPTVTSPTSTNQPAGSNTVTVTVTTTTLPEGVNLLTVTATNSAGTETTEVLKSEPDPAPPPSDPTPPPAPTDPAQPPAIISGPSKVTGNASASFATSGASEYRLNGGAWQAFDGSKPLTLTFPEGMNEIEFKAGNGSVTTPYPWFIGKRQYVLEGNVTGGLSGDVDVLSSEGIRVVSNGRQGAWLMNMNMDGAGSLPATPPGSSNVVAGGTSSGPNNEAGYWLSKIKAYTSAGALNGTSELTSLSPLTLGTGSGKVTGTISADAWQAQDLGLGSYTESPLKFMSQFRSISNDHGPIDNNHLTITLTWGAEPHDLDARLWIGDAGDHVDYEHRHSKDDDAHLDHDSFAGNGYEKITISKLKPGNRYYYSVYNNSNESAISNSHAHIVVKDRSGRTYSYDVPETGNGRWYNVFALEVDDQGQWQILTVNAISSSRIYTKSINSIDMSYSAILGSDQSLWGGAPFTVLGTYNTTDSVKRYVFQNEIYSYNATAANKTTYDGGAYAGWMGGILGDGVEGMIYAFYRDGSSNTGIIKGAFTGSTYPGIGMWEATGSFDPALNLGTTDHSPANLKDEILSTGFEYEGSRAYAGHTSGIMATAAGTTVRTVAIPSSTSLNLHRLPDLAKIGLWEASLSGTSGTVSIDTPTTYEMEITGHPTAYGVNVLFKGDLTPNTAPSYKLSGTAAGSWVDINGALGSAGSTGVIGGQVLGIFDPAAQTIKAAALGAWIETTKFLQMAGGATTTETANATLKALNIPAVQVGKATLSQGSEPVNHLSGVTMKDVTFFANSTGGAPRIWATNGVTGNYTSTPQGGGEGDAVKLSGGGLKAEFGIQNWNSTTGKWGAEIKKGTGALSGGTYNGNVTFTGGAAGSINSTAKTFSGTAAGIVK